MQQVLMTTLEALRAGRLRETDKLAPFVLGTCRMTVLDQRRTAQRQSALLQEFRDELLPAPRQAPPIDHGRLARCVQGLKERERTVVVLTFYDERTAADSGRALGLSEANVRVIRHRAIKQLRTCMEAAS